METLSWSGPEWDRVRSSALDEELDKYRLLAYLQRIDAHYKERKLYPYLDELHLRVHQLTELRKRAETLEAGMAGEALGLDLRRSTILRRSPNGSQLEQVHASTERALRELRRSMELGGELREELNQSIRCSPIGILPIGTREGWILLRQGNEAWAYSYVLPLVRTADPNCTHGQLRTRYFSTWTLGLARTYEQIKAELVRIGPFPNPAAFVFESDISLPRIETFMPLAKQLVYELVAGPLA